MTPDIPPLVERTLQRLIAALDPERVIVFGSYAKGTANSRSDVDLLVVAELGGNIQFHQRRARQLAIDCFPRVDVVIVSPDEVAEAGTAKSPFLQSILGTGIEIYNRLQQQMQPPHNS
jgi:predicted nucleotidyltransferase